MGASLESFFLRRFRFRRLEEPVRATEREGLQARAREKVFFAGFFLLSHRFSFQTWEIYEIA